MAKVKLKKEKAETKKTKVEEKKDEVEPKKKDAYSHLSEKNKKLMSDQKANFSGLRLKINTISKREVAVLGRDRAKIGIRRLSTGSFWLDYAAGGGIPANRFTMLWGEESTSKTTIALKAMADAQKRSKETYEYFTDLNLEEYKHDSETNLYIHKTEDKILRPLKCHYMDLEGAYDAEWARNLGVDVDSIDLSCPDTGPEAIDMMRKFINEKDKDGYPFIDVLVVDSLAVMTPLAEIESNMDKDHMGQQARMLNSAWRKISSDLAGIDPKKRPTIILINQLREKIGMVFGNPETRPGGNGQKFITSLEVRTKKGKVFCLDKENKYPLYQEMKGVINKNKTGAPKIEYGFNLAVKDYDPNTGEAKDAKYRVPFKTGDILEHDDIIKYAGKYQLFGKDDKGKFFVQLIDHPEPTIYQRQKDLINEWIYSDVVKYNQVKHDLIRIMTGKV